MKTKVLYKGGMHFVGQTASGHSVDWDSGPKGADTKGATPMELVLQAAAVCSAMDVVHILKKRRKKIADFELEIEGRRSENHPKVFENINIIFRLRGDGITEEEALKAAQLSQEKFCSVTNMLRPTVKISYKVEVK